MKTFILLIAFFLYFFLYAAMAQDTTTQDTSVQGQGGSATPGAALRIAYLVTGEEEMRLELNGVPFMETLSARSLSAYILVPAGDHQLELVSATVSSSSTGSSSAASSADSAPVAALSASIDQAQQTLSNAQEARPYLDTALRQIDEMRSAVTEDNQQVLQDVQQSLQRADDALQNEDQEAARQALEESQTRLADMSGASQANEEMQGQETAQDGALQTPSPLLSQTVTLEEGVFYTLLIHQPMPSETDQAADQQGQGNLILNVEPAEATLNVTGPGGYTQEVVGSTTLSDLPAGRYVVAATLEGYTSTNQTVDLQANQDTELELALQALEEGSEDQGDTAENQQEENQASAEVQRQIEVQLIQDNLRVPAAGLALVRMINVSSVASNVNVVLASAASETSEQSSEDQQAQTEGQEDTSQQDAQSGSEENATEDQSEQSTSETQAGEGNARLNIVLEPEQASEATITVSGPDGFVQELSGEGSLENLSPGGYIVDATLSGYQSTGVEVQLEAGQNAEITLELERLPEAGPPPISGQTLFSNLSFGSASDYQQLPAGRYTLQLQDVNEDIQLSEVGNFEVGAGVAYSLLAFDDGENGVGLLVSVDLLIPQEGQPEDLRNQENQGEQPSSEDENDVQAGGVPDNQEALRSGVNRAVDSTAAGDVDGALGEIREVLQLGDLDQTLQERLQEAEAALEAGNIAEAEEVLKSVQFELDRRP